MACRLNFGPAKPPHLQEFFNIERVGRKREQGHGSHGRVGRSIQQSVQFGLHIHPPAQQKLQPVLGPGDLGLQLDHSLQRARALGIAGLGQPFVVLENGFILPADLDDAIQIGQTVIGILDFTDEFGLAGPMLLPQHHGSLHRYRLAVLQLAEPGKALRYRNHGGLRPHSGFRTACILGDGQHRVGELANLGKPLQRCPVAGKALLEQGTAVQRLLDERLQAEISVVGIGLGGSGGCRSTEDQDRAKHCLERRPRTWPSNWV